MGSVLLVSGLVATVVGTWRGYVNARDALGPVVHGGEPTRTALEEPYARWDKDTYTRAQPSHVHDDVGWDLESYPAKKKKWKLDAGWHDAGNYDMYVPSTAPSAQALLLAYEWAPAAFDDEALAIPESGNGVPDILDEARWGLRWVLSMQEPDGAFRHREAVMASSPELPADQDRTVRWVAGVSLALPAPAAMPSGKPPPRRALISVKWGTSFFIMHWMVIGPTACMARAIRAQASMTVGLTTVTPLATSPPRT